MSEITNEQEFLGKVAVFAGIRNYNEIPIIK
jgi:hypothetical protein